MKLYCYGPHKEAAAEMMRAAGWNTELTVVNDFIPLRGVRGGVFVSAENDPTEIPGSILNQAEICGMIWVGLSDQWLRDAAWKRLP